MREVGPVVAGRQGPGGRPVPGVPVLGEHRGLGRLAGEELGQRGLVRQAVPLAPPRTGPQGVGRPLDDLLPLGDHAHHVAVAEDPQHTGQFLGAGGVQVDQVGGT